MNEVDTIADSRLKDILNDSRLEEGHQRSEAVTRHQSDQDDKTSALRVAISKRKTEMRKAVNQAIAEGRIPGRPSDYTISLPVFSRTGRYGPMAGHERIKTKLFPALDLRTMSYDDYPHHAELEAITKEVGFYVEGAA